ncbi:MAG: hypothetical protein JWO89_1763 [Verrucomicrobiaceae bacterium]|nr:hypothetical protein [Verrucomicrobiaceae bacterium]MDB6118346.1 hypothetical protein [Verrucomicrobiaceae bacterium]
MQRFTCDCGNVLFFGSSRCLKCGHETGYDPEREAMVRLLPDSDMKRCANGLKHDVCNWVLPKNSTEVLCVACRMNRTIPDLSNERNRTLWGRMETAKRRLLYTLFRLGISLPTKAENAKTGLAFDFISTVANPDVTTGHLNGIITVNLEEADDTYRQINRQQLGENSRTLLGHFRHESAHYFWQRCLSELLWEDPLRIAFRERFGNEWQDYASSLSQHYQWGAPADWDQKFITAYAASHPWEDWAETWAHYLEIVDGLETCESLGIQVRHIALPLVVLPVEAGFLPTILPSTIEEEGEFLAWLQRWMCLSTVLNEVSYSLGEQPLYPFVISVGAAQKLRMAHYYAKVWGMGNGRAFAPAASSQSQSQ